MEKPTEIPDRRPLSAEAARAFAKEHADAWREVREVARQVCARGKGDARHEIAARFGVWPIAHTMNFDVETPTGVGVDCGTGEFRTARGGPVSDQGVEVAANMACAVDGRVVLGQVHNHLRIADGPSVPPYRGKHA